MFINGSLDKSHLWGDFKEYVLDAYTIMRHIVVYNDGRTSIHSHNKQNEYYLILSGTLTLYLNDQIQHLEPGTVVHIPAYSKHAASCIKTEFCEYIEVVIGDQNTAQYTDDIIKYDPAIPGSKIETGILK